MFYYKTWPEMWTGPVASVDLSAILKVEAYQSYQNSYLIRL